MKKRILSMVLAVSVTMSLLVAGAGTAFADGHDYENPYPVRRAVTTSSEGEDSYTTTVEYTYDESGNLLTETSWASYYEDYVEQYAWTYDSAGNILTETRSYSENGSAYTPYYQETWTYNSYGNVLTEYFIQYSEYPDVDCTYQASYAYTYNEDGTIATEYCSYNTVYVESGETYEGSYQYSYTYDSHGNVLTDTYSDRDGFTEIFTYTYTYGENGNILSQTCLDNDGNTWVCTYDENGNLLTDTTSYIYGDASTCSYTYDVYGNKLTETYSDSDGEGYACTYAYTYDEGGNILTEAVYYNGELSYTTTYTYLDQTTPTEPTEDDPFTDVTTSNYFYDSVLWAVNSGITTGTSDTTFSPFQTAERCQVVTFLWRAAGCPDVEEGTENPFTDVNEDDYFYTAVLWAVEQGITSGTTDTTFSPFAKCERCQVVTFLYRYAGEPEVTTTSNPFTDVDTDDYFYNAVLWAVDNGITTGTSDTTFGPFVTCERCMVVTFLYRALVE